MMTTPLYSLLFFAMWTLGLVVVGLGPFRVGRVLKGEAAPNAFPSDTPHGPDWYRRVTRAHANCVENLPVFGAVVVAGALSGLSSTTFDRLAIAYVVARVGQSVAHISSARSAVINVRFTFFLVQIVCVVWMATLVGISAR
jgi:uncharacterized MAPEG superfamily protein